MTTDTERLIITLIVLIGGAVLITLSQSQADLASGILALDGLVIGWWFPRNGHQSPVAIPERETADLRPWEGA